MKLKQKEYCHNCNRYVVYEFDDVTERQVIICPNCGHEHYREIDEGTILNIRARQGQRVIRIAKLKHISLLKNDIDQLKPLNIEVEERDVLGEDESGNTIVKPKEGDKTRKVVTNRRWGRDQRQIQ